MRGHTLVWCEGNPAWLKTLGSGREAERELRRHIERIVDTLRDDDPRLGRGQRTDRGKADVSS